MSNYYVYILASRRNGTLYVGVTSDLLRRVYEHKNDFVAGFTKKYGVHTLVYFDVCRDREGAIQREKQIKEWKRPIRADFIPYLIGLTGFRLPSEWLHRAIGDGYAGLSAWLSAWLCRARNGDWRVTWGYY